MPGTGGWAGKWGGTWPGNWDGDPLDGAAPAPTPPGALSESRTFILDTRPRVFILDTRPRVCIFK